MRGCHYLKGWSKTQQCVTLSSAEAELVAMNRATSELLGILSMLTDLGEKGRKNLQMEQYAGTGAAVRGSRSAAAGTVQEELIGVVCGDYSAALAISNRKGCGKLRHIHVGQLWLQERVSNKDFAMKKVLGNDNPADLYTKHVNSSKKESHCERLACELREGRAKA